MLELGAPDFRSFPNIGTIAADDGAFRNATYCYGTYDFLIANGFATARTCSTKSCATGLSARLFRVTIPFGTRAVGSSTGKTLIPGRVAGNVSTEVGKIERKGPAATILSRTSGGTVNTVARG